MSTCMRLGWAKMHTTRKYNIPHSWRQSVQMSQMSGSIAQLLLDGTNCTLCSSVIALRVVCLLLATLIIKVKASANWWVANWGVNIWRGDSGDESWGRKRSISMNLEKYCSPAYVILRIRDFLSTKHKRVIVRSTTSNATLTWIS